MYYYKPIHPINIKTMKLGLKTTIVLLGFLFGDLTYAAKVETVEIYSKAMNKKCPSVVLIPDTYANDTRTYPVVYLLHTYGGDQNQWARDVSCTATLVDLYGIIAVCPDGGRNSWYFDSPINDKIRYETHITEEVVNYVDSNYRTIKKRSGRAITGASMGGHGSLFLAFRHKDTFGAAGAIMGGVDIRPFPGRWDISQQLGGMKEHPENWEAYSANNNVSLIKEGGPAIIIDCGVKDFFLGVNRALHERLLKNNISHDYIERPGGHTLDYMNNSIKFQMLFFNNYFTK